MIIIIHKVIEVIAFLVANVVIPSSHWVVKLCKAKFQLSHLGLCNNK
jgi:hypothetical protein